MKFARQVVTLSAALTMLASAAFAQSRHTEHTFVLDDPEHRPAATLDDVAWLVGSWKGEGFGSTFEEVWNPPSAGSMVGMFKLHDGDSDPDFTSWEDKNDYGQFRFIRADPDAVHFSGLSFYRIDETTVHAYLAANFGDGLREEKLIYRRN